MKVVVTGAKGFIGKNLCIMLEEQGCHEVVKIDSESTLSELQQGLRDADFVYHLAGVNRPKSESEFKQGNVELTNLITSELTKLGNKTPIMISSSTQAQNNNAYGLSKVQAEQIVSEYSKDTGAEHFIYRFPNVFGKWCRPNYNSFIATFCHNIINDLDLNIHDPSSQVTLVYIDDVCKELVNLLTDVTLPGYKSVTPEYRTTVGDVADILIAFKDSRDTITIESVGTGLTRALYSTYLSYLPPQKFSYRVPSYVDERGAFCEMLKTKDSGQFSFFTAHPGITRGGHYHHSKNEKFLVIKGQALFKFEHIITGEQYQISVSSDEYTVVETAPGWSHDVTNTGDDELIVMLWANEIFDREDPDTIAKPL